MKFFAEASGQEDATAAVKAKPAMMVTG